MGYHHGPSGRSSLSRGRPNWCDRLWLYDGCDDVQRRGGLGQRQEVHGNRAGREGTERHTATVVGDTVGDPFKDTSGPALNILIKLMCMVSLVMAPLMVKDDWATVLYGLIPLALIFIVTFVVYKLYWAGYEQKQQARHAKFNAMSANGVANGDGAEMNLLGSV